MFSGLSAFPITPLVGGRVDPARVQHVVGRLREAGVDSIGALGSTGSYPYLTRGDRAAAARAAVEAAGPVPVLVGVGALTTAEVLANAEDAQRAGAAALLVSIMTYQALSDDEVFGLFEDVAASSSVPICVYDNPGTTHVRFSDELHGRIAALPTVRSIKLPGAARPEFDTRLRSLRRRVPEGVSLGVSGDRFAADALLGGGADVWYSVLAGTLPRPALELTRAAQRGDVDGVATVVARLRPLFELFDRHGSYRVITQVAVELGLVEAPGLPLPVRPVPASVVDDVRAALSALDVD